MLFQYKVINAVNIFIFEDIYLLGLTKAHIIFLLLSPSFPFSSCLSSHLLFQMFLSSSTSHLSPPTFLISMLTNCTHFFFFFKIVSRSLIFILLSLESSVQFYTSALRSIFILALVAADI